MTYLQFHLIFILPPIAALAVWSWRSGALGRREAALLGALATIALVYTTPWDNYLVWRGVWGYGSERVIGTIGYVPVEEYLFFILQPVLTGLWLFVVLRSGRWKPAPVGRGAAWWGAGAGLALTVAGLLLLRHEPGTYLGLILVWAAPPLAGQWAYAGQEIAARLTAWAVAVGVPTLYLWIADAVAIRQGVWTISERYTLGPSFAGLPLEEATFFLVTNLLVVQGLMLFLYAPAHARAARFESASA
jgi:lycopene beta-cyclase